VNRAERNKKLRDERHREKIQKRIEHTHSEITGLSHSIIILKAAKEIKKQKLTNLTKEDRKAGD